MVVLFFVLLALGVAQTQTWVIQNTYRFPSSCVPQNLISIKAWRHNVCVKTSATRWQRKSCNDTTLTEQTFSDSTCTTVVSTRQPLPVNTCGSISASDGSTQGVFFSCASLSAPPTLSNQNNDVFSEFLYLPDSSGPSCNISNTYQVASYQSNVCITGENRTCLGSGQVIFNSPCNGGASPSSTGGCLFDATSAAMFSSSTLCSVAVTPTPPPANPQNPPGSSPATISECRAATSLSECVGGLGISPSGFPTLPTTGLIRKCCVWCGTSSSVGSCKEPDFSSGLCTCPSNGTSTTDLARIFQCTGVTQLACSCTGRPIGAPTCQSYTGGTTGGFASLLSLSWGAVVMAILVFVTF